MKKYIKIISVLLFVFILTGCKSDKNIFEVETDLYNSLQEQKIIEDLTYVTTITCYDYIIEDYVSEEFIYKNKWGDLFKIYYQDYYGDKDYDYVVEISTNGIELEDPFYITEETGYYYEYDDGTMSLKPKYEFGNITYYTVKEKDKLFGLFGTYFEFEKVES
jgi:hypothetical protein